MASVGVLLAERIQDRAYKYDMHRVNSGIQHFCIPHRAARNMELYMHIPLFRGYLIELH